MTEGPGRARVEPRRVEAGGRRLTAAVHRPGGPVVATVAVAHPHPAHGGHMDHPVVVALAERCAAAGVEALRFDFGGVRESEGDVADAAAHLADVAAASAAADAGRGLPRLGAGFSYGAKRWLALAAGDGVPGLRGLLLLAPPTRVLHASRDFGALLLGRPIPGATRDEETLENLARVPVPARVVVGEQDGVCPAAEVRAAAAPSVHLESLAGLNHFFARGAGANPAALDVLVPALDAALRALLRL